MCRAVRALRTARQFNQPLAHPYGFCIVIRAQLRTWSFKLWQEHTVPRLRFGFAFTTLGMTQILTFIC